MEKNENILDGNQPPEGRMPTGDAGDGPVKYDVEISMSSKTLTLVLTKESITRRFEMEPEDAAVLAERLSAAADFVAGQ